MLDTATRLTESISTQVIAGAGALGATFAAARPFKHVVIDHFLDTAFAHALLRDFPKFDPERARSEFGSIGGKAVNERIATISDSYAQFYSLLESPEFLALMGQLTGIADLLHDPNMFGGGTHENLHGQELDPHIDFNYDPPTKLHRRINLLVYLNPGWRREWGGQIELHSNPRRPDENEIISVDPTFNRAVLFETNEVSWHGFPRIELPEDKRHLSRKSLSIYLYSKDRPDHEKVPEHGTFYVQRWLPPHIRAGHVLGEEDMRIIRSLLVRRDSWIEHYQKAELRTSGQMGELYQRIRQLEQAEA
jgi:Rps23 Pro-64 3,4-dihydroxylase Tpa1-like proline 4-hydroxylase